MPDVNNYPNDAVYITHHITYSGNLTLAGNSNTKIILGPGAFLDVTGKFTVNSGRFNMDVGSSLSATLDVILNKPSHGKVLDGTISSGGDMQLSGAFSGSPIFNVGTVGVGGDLMIGPGNGTQNYIAVSFNIVGNMTVQSVNLKWVSGTVNVGGDFLQTSGSTKINLSGGVPDGILDITGDIDIDGNTTIKGKGTVNWGGNIGISGNNNALGAGCATPYIPSFNLNDCSGGNPDPLPVEFLETSADCSTEGAIISWATAMEKNNSHFIVQRSYDLVNYADISEVNGAGNSSSIIRNDYNDEIISSSSTSYYRIKQVDYDGASDYSKVVSINCIYSDRFFYIYPTVSKGEFTIEFSSPISEFTVDV